MYKVASVILFVGFCWCLPTKNTTDSVENELLLAKMDYLEYKFMELQVEMKQQSESILQKLDDNKRVVVDKTSEILEHQRLAANYEELKRSLFELRPRKDPSDNSKLLGNKTSNSRPTISSCEEEPSKQSGIYLMNVDLLNRFEVYCEQDAYEGGWIVIQNRFNGSVDFYRNWTEYKEGFGDLGGEFWLGLDKIHALTKAQPRELLIQVEDFAGNVYQSRYGSFAVGKEREKYELKPSLVYLGGILGDSFTEHKGQKFSTYDVDNDSYGPDNCAKMYHGGWWYFSCHKSNLNGLYKDEANPETMSWHALDTDYQGLSASKMMIR